VLGLKSLFRAIEEVRSVIPGSYTRSDLLIESKDSFQSDLRSVVVGAANADESIRLFSNTGFAIKGSSDTVSKAKSECKER
jgi:hypothetical protein